MKETNSNILSKDIRQAIADIKAAILQSQYKVAQTANAEMLSLYYGIGRYVSENTRANAWGTNAIETISCQLQKELPGLRGFSATAIKRMRIFYEQWADEINRPSTMDDSRSASNALDIAAFINRPLLMDDLDVHDFCCISFTHHYEILSKTKNIKERIFYIKQTAHNHWSIQRLTDEIRADSYHHQSRMPNNFAQTMPSKANALKAIEMFKDNYLLDFVNMEELGARDAQDVDERIVEQRIVQNVKNFIMTFGTDFTFVGNQYHLEKFGIEQYPDLLFYNRELSALVCVELKFGDFKPAYLGQLSAYLRILDSEVKKPHENPSIGIVLCKSANKAFVEFLIQGYDNPMGVATYKTKEDIKKLLPSEKQLQDLLEK